MYEVAGRQYLVVGSGPPPGFGLPKASRGRLIDWFLRLFNAADQNGWPVYLETQERRSTKLYARLGLKMLQDGIETLPDGPLTWTMWREPPAETRA